MPDLEIEMQFDNAAAARAYCSSQKCQCGSNYDIHIDEQSRLRLADVHGVTLHYLGQIRQMWYGWKFACKLLHSSILGVQNTDLCIWTFIVQKAMHLYNYVRLMYALRPFLFCAINCNRALSTFFCNVVYTNDLEKN